LEHFFIIYTRLANDAPIFVVLFAVHNSPFNINKSFVICICYVVCPKLHVGFFEIAGFFPYSTKMVGKAARLWLLVGVLICSTAPSLSQDLCGDITVTVRFSLPMDSQLMTMNIDRIYCSGKA
jgi:hypothetical protein